MNDSKDGMATQFTVFDFGAVARGKAMSGNDSEESFFHER
jgi:hypothetical protein